MGKVGNVNAAFDPSRRHVSLWRCRRTRIWISPDTIGIVINPTASAGEHVHQVTEMTKDDKQTMDAHDITCKSKSIYQYKSFKYERLADAVRYAEIDAERPCLKDGNS